MSEEEEEKISKKIKKTREGGDEWFREHYLEELQRLGTLRNKFGVTELKEEEIKKLPESLRKFVPYACKNCGYDRKIPRRVFKIETLPQKRREWKELKHYMRKKYDVYYFKVRPGIGITTLNAGKCPRCESQYVLFAYGLLLKKPNKEKK